MTSKRPWQCSLDETLQSLATPTTEAPPRVSILGIGNELRGDDAAGVAIVRALQPLAHNSLQVLEGAHAPENLTGLICRFEPDLVLLIDAVDIDQTPGQIAWIDWRATSGISASTHTMPLYMIGKYLHAMTGCEVALIGIQPASLAPDAGVDVGIEASVADVVRQLTTRLDRVDR